MFLKNVDILNGKKVIAFFASVILTLLSHWLRYDPRYDPWHNFEDGGLMIIFIKAKVYN